MNWKLFGDASIFVAALCLTVVGVFAFVELVRIRRERRDAKNRREVRASFYKRSR